MIQIIGYLDGGSVSYLVGLLATGVSGLWYLIRLGGRRLFRSRRGAEPTDDEGSVDAA